jgi:hypothetical protein
VTGIIGAEGYRRRDVMVKRAAYHEAGHCLGAIAYGVPIISVTVSPSPHMLRAHYHAPADIGLEAICILCLAGPASEEYFCGKIDDGSDQTDITTVRKYLSRQYDALQIRFQFDRLRDAADKLVRTEWAQQRIKLIAAELLARGTLSAEDIAALVS